MIYSQAMNENEIEPGAPDSDETSPKDWIEPKQEPLTVVDGGVEISEVATTSIEQLATKLGFTETEEMIQIRRELAELALRGEIDHDILLSKYTAYQDAGINISDIGVDTRAGIGKMLLEANLLATHGHADIALEQINEIIAVSWGDKQPEDSISLPLLLQAVEIIRQRFTP